jgi:hypothetical protein
VLPIGVSGIGSVPTATTARWTGPTRSERAGAQLELQFLGGCSRARWVGSTPETDHHWIEIEGDERVDSTVAGPAGAGDVRLQVG